MAVVGYIDIFSGSECAGWVIDEEDPRKTITVCLIVNGEEKHVEEANLDRVDLSNRYSNTKHGFSFGLSDFVASGKNILKLIVKDHDFSFKTDTIAFDSRENSSFVEIGTAGWLFLQNDSNKTRDIIAGKFPLSDAAVDRIIRGYGHLTSYFASKNIKMATYIVPDKGVVCNKFRQNPLEISSSRAAQQLSTAARNNGLDSFRYGLEDLAQLEEPATAFTKYDTHPSAIGQKIIVESVLSQLNLVFDADSVTENVESFSGDLGSKLTPPQAGPVTLLKPLFNTADLIDEVTPAVEQRGLKLTGRRAFHRNPDRIGSCVLLGTSSAYYMRDFFFSVFHETHYFWTAKLSVSAIDVIRPDCVVFLATERVVAQNFMDNDAVLHPL